MAPLSLSNCEDALCHLEVMQRVKDPSVSQYDGNCFGLCGYYPSRALNSIGDYWNLLRYLQVHSA